MSRKSLTSLVSFGVLSLLTSGCGGDAPKPTDSPSPSPSAAAPATVQPVASSAPAFSQPLVPPQATVKTDKEVQLLASNPQTDIAAGLIPVTDSEIATKAVPKGRTDPFASVIAQPTAPTVSSPPVLRSSQVQPFSTPVQPSQRLTTANNTAVPTSSKAGSSLGIASIAEMAKKSSTPTPKIAAVPKVLPSRIIATSKVAANNVTYTATTSSTATQAPLKTALLTPPAAPAPQPEFSQGIQVSGIAEINGQTQVIVKLPGESFSRYISVGERVMNGKVLIKRVQDRTAIAPIVVLEEVGVEVFRRVGEKPLLTAKDSKDGK